MDIVDSDQPDLLGRLARLRAAADSFPKARGPAPFVPQQNEAECAAASLETVIRYFRKRAGLPRCRQAVQYHREGASLFDLQRGAESLGFECLGVRADFHDDFDSLPLPFIVGIDQHFVVVDGREGSSARLMDPAIGRRRMPLVELTDKTQGVCLLLAPGPEFLQWKDERADYSRYRQLAREHTSHLAQAFGYSLLLLGVGAAGPWLAKLVFDEVIPLGDAGMLAWIAVGYAVVVLASMLVELVRKRVVTKLGFEIHRKLAVALYHRLFRWPLSDFLRRTPGDMAAALEEVSAIRDFVTGQAGASLLVCLHPIAYFAMLVWIAPQLMVVPLLVAPIYAVMPRLLGPELQRRNAQQVNRVAKLETMLMEQINGYRTIKAMAAEAQVQVWWQERLDAYLRQTLKAERAISPLKTAMDFFPALVTLSCLVLAAREVIAGEMSVGAMIAGTLLVSQILGPIAGIARNWPEFQKLAVSAERVEEAFANPVEEPGGDSPAEVAGDVELKDATFRYGRAERPVLDGLNLVFRRGELTALVGRSGSGKTTIAQLVNRLLTPESGSVAIGGVDVRELSLERLRRAVGVVLSEDHLFEDSVLENIALGSAQPPDQARAEQACRHAQIHEFVLSLPSGYATRLPESGKGLSSGEKQRLILARTLYRDPAILLLDDVTSHLDPAIEKCILEHLQSAKAGKTIIITTHEPQVLAYADRVIALEDGAVRKDLRTSELEAQSIFETM